jgi:hypothetical protein
MKTFKLENGDRVISGGQVTMVNGRECLAQRLKNSIALDKGSWFLDTDKGIEWLDILGNKSVSARALYSKIRKILGEDSEVTAINSIEITTDRSTRELSVSFSVDSTYGEIEGTI